VNSLPLPEDLSVRPVEERDGPSLAAFACSTGAHYEDEVEQFIRTSALTCGLVGRPRSGYRLLVVLERERLIAVGGYRPEMLLVEVEREEETKYIFRGDPATRLHVLALSLEQQGRRLPDGRRMSDLVMQTLMADALGKREEMVLTAVVARDNLRSLALCTRHRLTSQIEYDRRHVRLSGRFVRSR
jgi:hypothetical protein